MESHDTPPTSSIAQEDAAPPVVAPRDYAFFFDIDGTLAAITDTPEETRIPADTVQILQRLVKASDDAVAIVTGRPFAEIDPLLAPLVLAGAGLHGAQWRDPDGMLGKLAVDEDKVAHMARTLTPMIDDHRGLLLEFKGMGFAIHYRNAPECGDMVLDALGKLIQSQPGFVLQTGKMVVEIKPSGASKAGAIDRFMQQAPFAGRIPLFAGDDLTDEAGFAAVHRRDGLSIKVGSGPTSARFRVSDPPALSAWLATLV